MKAGWEVKELRSVSAINYGYTESASSEPVGPRFLRITDIQNDRVDWESVPYCKIESSDIPRYRLTSGDIVFARTGATTGKSFLVVDPPDAIFASYLIRLRLIEKKLLPEFVSLFFQTADYWKAIKDGSSGSTQGGFNATKLGALSIPVPPILEQQRIVAILDEAFNSITTATANAARNLQNARELFESYLQAVFSQRGEGWVEKTLGDVCELFQGLAINAKSEHLLVHHSSLPLLRIKDLRNNSAEQFVAESGYPPNARVDESEIIYTRTGQIGLVFRGRSGVLHNNCFKVRPKSALNDDYLFWWLQSPVFRNRIIVLASKAAQPDITHSIFKAQPIFVPPLEFQRKAAGTIVELSKETQRLESIYQRKLAALEALKQSLLHQAFSGEL